MIGKTRAWLKRGTCQGTRYTPGFINGLLPRDGRVRKVLFYCFGKHGDLIVCLVNVKRVRTHEVQIEMDL